MEYRPLYLTVISAKDINEVNPFSKMDVYAVVFLSTDPRSQQKTPVDRDYGRGPKWNHSIKFSVPDNPAAPPPVLKFVLRSDRALGDRDIGQVHVPIEELLDTAAKGDAGATYFASYQVRKPSGKPKGVLNFSFKFGDMAYRPGAGHGAYPLPPQGAVPGPPGHAYPPPAGYWYGGHPPPATAGYGYPPLPQGYGPPPPPQGYGYPPKVEVAVAVAPPQKPKKNKLDLGLGVGLLGGALGGLLIGNMIAGAADNSDAYEAEYDAGFDDSDDA